MYKKHTYPVKIKLNKLLSSINNQYKIYFKYNYILQ